MTRPRTTHSLRDGLLTEHARLDELLQDVSRATEARDTARVANAWKVFVSALVAQMTAEDALLVSHLPHERSARILAQEHMHIRGRVNELARAIEEQSLQARALTDLRDVLRAHARNDDRLLYAWAETDLSEHQRDAVLESLGTRLAISSDR